MDEKKVERIAAEIMLAAVNNTDGTAERWLEVYAAIHAVLRIHECSPTVFLKGITPDHVQKAEDLGRTVGNKTADNADNFAKTFRN